MKMKAGKLVWIKKVLKVKVMIIAVILFYRITGFGSSLFGSNLFCSNLFSLNGQNMALASNGGQDSFAASMFGTSSLGTSSLGTSSLGTSSLRASVFGSNSFGQQNKTSVEKDLDKLHKIQAKAERPVMEKVTIYSQKSDNSDEKIIRKGILSKVKNPKANVVLCHGFTCDKNDIGFMRYMFKDCNCLTFDFRAHGENVDGQFCTLGKNEAYDVKAAFDFLKSHPDTKGLINIVYAFSMGSVSAIEAQARFGHLYDAAIFDCPFDSTENVVNRGLDNKKITVFGYEFDIPGKIILRKYLFHPYVQSFVKALLRCAEQINGKSVNTFVCPVCAAESIKKVNVPSLFILCKNDEKISIDNIKTIYYNSPAKYKKLLLTGGKKHFGSYFDNPEEYCEKIGGFVSKVISGQLCLKNKHKIIDESLEAEDIKGTVEIVDSKKETPKKAVLAKEILVKDIDRFKGSTEIAVVVKDIKLAKKAIK